MVQLKGQVFVGHVFNERYRDDLRPAISKAFKELHYDFQIYYADMELVSGDIWTKITRRIRESFFCIFEASITEKPNVFIELGYALACKKHCILLIENGKEPPSDLAGFSRIIYGSMKQVKERLKDYLPNYLTSVINGHLANDTIEMMGPIDKRVVQEVSRHHNGISRDDLSEMLKKIDVADKEISSTLQTCLKCNFIEKDGDLIKMSESGSKYMRELRIIS